MKRIITRCEFYNDLSYNCGRVFVDWTYECEDGEKPLFFTYDFTLTGAKKYYFKRLNSDARERYCKRYLRKLLDR